MSTEAPEATPTSKPPRPKVEDLESLGRLFVEHHPRSKIGIYRREPDGQMSGRWAEIEGVEHADDLEKAIAMQPGYLPGKHVAQLRIKGFHGHVGQVDIKVDLPPPPEPTPVVEKSAAPTPVAADPMEQMESAFSFISRFSNIVNPPPVDVETITRLAKLEAQAESGNNFSLYLPIIKEIASGIPTMMKLFATQAMAASAKVAEEPKEDDSVAPPAGLDVKCFLDLVEETIDGPAERAARMIKAAFGPDVGPRLVPLIEDVLRLADERPSIATFVKDDGGEAWLLEALGHLGIQFEEKEPTP